MNTLHTIANRLVQTPQAIELDAERILCNDIHLPNSRINYHKVKLWVIGNEYGALCAVWADCEQDALDEGCDAGLLDSFLVSPEDEAKMTDEEREELTHIGNAGESADLERCWMAEVSFDRARDFELLMALAQAKGACAYTLDDI